MRERPIVLVAALGRNRVIGRAGGLPWRMRSDLRHFKAATLGRPVIMGRRTYASIGRPLPGRTIIVVTRDPAFEAEGVRAVDGVEAALVLANLVAREDGAPEVIVAGGAQVYEAAMGQADWLLLSWIDLEPEGDALFPPLDLAEWREVSRVPHPRGEGDDASFEVAAYERRPG